MSTPTEVTSIAEQAEAILNDTFAMKGEEFGFHLPEAMLVGINTTTQGVKIQPELARHGDIYQLIDSVNKFTVQGFDALGLVTCGWAAPITEGQTEPDGAPSAHPQRRRVRLFVCVNREGMASVLRFQDDADEQVLDAGEAGGPLADAIAELATRANGK